MNNSNTYNNMPAGFVMALSQNPNALNYFSSLPKKQQQIIINQTQSINSKHDMRIYVDKLSHQQFF